MGHGSTVTTVSTFVHCPFPAVIDSKIPIIKIVGGCSPTLSYSMICRVVVFSRTYTDRLPPGTSRLL